MIKYIDISEHNGIVDFEHIKVDGVMIRAGYGRNNIDKQFVRNISECNRLGIPCGVYWFSYARTVEMVKDEAKFCIAAIKPYRVESPIAFDFEYDSVVYASQCGVNITPKMANQFADAFCRTIEENGYYAMIYANRDYLTRYFTDVSAYDLWLADWGVSKPYKSCGIWQKGTETINGAVFDSNIAYKDYPAIIADAGLNHLSEVKPEDWAKSNGLLDGRDIDGNATIRDVVNMLFDYDALDKPYSGLMSED